MSPSLSQNLANLILLSFIFEDENAPEYFRGMRVIDAIADMFVHLNHHNGHLSAIKGDWNHFHMT